MGLPASRVTNEMPDFVHMNFTLDCSYFPLQAGDSAGIPKAINAIGIPSVFPIVFPTASTRCSDGYTPHQHVPYPMECASRSRFSIAAPQSCCQNSERSFLPHMIIATEASKTMEKFGDRFPNFFLTESSVTTTNDQGREFLALGAFIADSSIRSMSARGISPGVYFLMLLRPSMASLQSIQITPMLLTGDS